jgi:hypothetical protein
VRLSVDGVVSPEAATWVFTPPGTIEVEP